MKVRVTTVEVATGKQRGESRTMDMAKASVRQWIMRHTSWAVNNGYGVAINAVEAETNEHR